MSCCVVYCGEMLYCGLLFCDICFELFPLCAVMWLGASLCYGVLVCGLLYGVVSCGFAFSGVVLFGMYGSVVMHCVCPVRCCGLLCCPMLCCDVF